MSDVVSREKVLEFGRTLVTSIYASERNPHRVGIFVKRFTRRGRMNPGKHYLVTDGRGEFWEVTAESTTTETPADPGAAVALAEKFCGVTRFKRSGINDKIAMAEAMRQLRVAEDAYLAELEAR